MANIDQMIKAHENIRSSILEITRNLENIEENAAIIARSISQLAGVIKIHLGNEDRFLYPAMKNSIDPMLQKKANDFQNEMGNLSTDFMVFKDNYNTKSRILNNRMNAKKDIENMCDRIIKRMDREDNELYPLGKRVM